MSVLGHQSEGFSNRLNSSECTNKLVLERLQTGWQELNKLLRFSHEKMIKAVRSPCLQLTFYREKNGDKQCTKSNFNKEAMMQEVLGLQKAHAATTTTTTVTPTTTVVTFFFWHLHCLNPWSRDERGLFFSILSEGKRNKCESKRKPPDIYREATRGRAKNEVSYARKS
mmetsp:Transcript_12063/g.23274  ORF Transcript_12063/g.23274 Transcript_12063/m.23274 type:complete len:169 (-) Transcript_12063:1391-1897(-)